MKETENILEYKTLMPTIAQEANHHKKVNFKYLRFRLRLSVIHRMAIQRLFCKSAER